MAPIGLAPALFRCLRRHSRSIASLCAYPDYRADEYYSMDRIPHRFAQPHHKNSGSVRLAGRSAMPGRKGLRRH
jgi:hypothetical protein